MVVIWKSEVLYWFSKPRLGTWILLFLSPPVQPWSWCRLWGSAHTRPSPSYPRPAHAPDLSFKASKQ